MKILIFISVLSLSMQPAFTAEGGSFEESRGEKVRPERTNLKLPKAVKYRMIEAQKHEYVVFGIYDASANNEVLRDVASLYKTLIPEALQFDLDFKAKRAQFVTSRKLTLSELAYALDDMAKLGGDIPYWAELEARDIEHSKDFFRIQYEMKPVTEKFPVELAWFAVPKDRAFQMPLSLAGDIIGSLLVVPSTAHCMCHSKFHIRILDPEGKLIWHEENTACADVRIALSDDNEFGMHQIWLSRRDHGVMTRFLIRGHFLPEPENDQTDKGQPAKGND